MALAIVSMLGLLCLFLYLDYYYSHCYGHSWPEPDDVISMSAMAGPEYCILYIIFNIVKKEKIACFQLCQIVNDSFSQVYSQKR